MSLGKKKWYQFYETSQLNLVHSLVKLLIPLQIPKWFQEPLRGRCCCQVLSVFVEETYCYLYLSLCLKLLRKYNESLPLQQLSLFQSYCIVVWYRLVEIFIYINIIMLSEEFSSSFTNG